MSFRKNVVGKRMGGNQNPLADMHSADSETHQIYLDESKLPYILSHSRYPSSSFSLTLART